MTISSTRNSFCDACGGPHARWTASLGLSLCAACERAGVGHPDREPVLVGEVLAGTAEALARAARAAGSTTLVRVAGRSDRSGGADHSVRSVRTVRADRSDAPSGAVRDPRRTVCRTCGGDAEWHRTVLGRWLMIEPGAWPVGCVPAGKRWHIAADGTAVTLAAPAPYDRCRISHFDVCPLAPAPTGSPVLLALWRRNAQRVA
ncbi:hypothetical protein J7E97_35195 [Streptomyces sp. ISL-66]|uniref:DUF6083 domain-containing protein n=1 Tax=Streptomyces sp. ISL-66 TaxID=2819186 RepID=UPI001BE90BF8|nr:DUF6083 domain-containing protein [Streptomyces sp. ISL-66]MBT2472957.1 hypothetical protein [Streptomyces sp. ISL-66]